MIRILGLAALPALAAAVEFSTGLGIGPAQLAVAGERTGRVATLAGHVHALWPLVEAGPCQLVGGLRAQAGAAGAMDGDDRFAAIQVGAGPVAGMALDGSAGRFHLLGLSAAGIGARAADAGWDGADGVGGILTWGAEAAWTWPYDETAGIGPRLSWSRTRFDEGLRLDEARIGIAVTWTPAW